MRVCVGSSKDSSGLNQLTGAVKNSIYSSLPSKLEHTCTHTQTQTHTHYKLHPPTLLSTLSSVKPSLSCNPHGPSSSVSQQSTSLWQWPKFLLSVCVCTYVCCVCRFEDIISAYDSCTKVGVCLCIVAFFSICLPCSVGWRTFQ